MKNNSSEEYKKYLTGGDLRTLGKSKILITKIDDQNKFNQLFQLLEDPDRKITMRAADVIEKITLSRPEFLNKHKRALFKLCENATDKELKWHLALLMPRLSLSQHEFGTIWHILSKWATDRKESRIVRVHSLQGLYELLSRKKELKKDFEQTLEQLSKEEIPSIQARIRILKKKGF